jgi:hypothetical protein
MSCVVGLIEGKEMWLGADSQGSGADDKYYDKSHKVFEKGSYLIGHAGSPRANQLIQHGPSPPRLTQKRKDNLIKFMCNEFVNYMMGRFIECGFAKNDAGHIETEDAFIVAVDGRLFTVWADFQVMEAEYPYMAIGTGAPVALGSLFSSEGIPPELRVALALDAAKQFVTTVGGELVVIKKRIR